MPDKADQTAVEAREGEPASPTKSAQEVDGRIDRIVHETRQLGDDLAEWANLRLRLVQLDIQERIDEELDLVFSRVVVLAMVVIAVLMASFGIAFVLGDLLGEPWYGFAIMAVVYLVAAGIISQTRPRLAANFRSSWASERRQLEAGTSETDH